MSQADFEKASNRVEQAKQDVLWALDVLDDPATNLGEYELTQEEVDELFDEFHADLGEILTATARVLFRRANIEVEDQIVAMVGPIPPWLARIAARSGPVTPWEA